MQPINEFLDTIEKNCEVISEGLDNFPLSAIQLLSEQRGRLIQYRVTMKDVLPVGHRMFNVEAKIEKTISIFSVDLR